MPLLTLWSQGLMHDGRSALHRRVLTRRRRIATHSVRSLDSRAGSNPFDPARERYFEKRRGLTMEENPRD